MLGSFRRKKTFTSAFFILCTQTYVICRRFSFRFPSENTTTTSAGLPPCRPPHHPPWARLLRWEFFVIFSIFLDYLWVVGPLRFMVENLIRYCPMMMKMSPFDRSITLTNNVIISSSSSYRTFNILLEAPILSFIFTPKILFLAHIFVVICPYFSKREIERVFFVKFSEIWPIR